LVVRLCDDQCPCDSSELCKYCKYCTFCPVCSLCSAACAEDSFIRSSLSWFDGWKSKALDILGVDKVDVPDLEKVDQDLKNDDVERRLRGTRVKLLVDDLMEVSDDEVFLIWRVVAKEADWESLATDEQIKTVNAMAERVLGMSAEEQEAVWHRLHKRRPELWKQAENLNAAHAECTAADDDDADGKKTKDAAKGTDKAAHDEL
jgi:hypothetical protein